MKARHPSPMGLLIVMAALVALPLVVQGGSGTDDQAESVARHFAGIPPEPTPDDADADATTEQALFVGQGVAGLAALAWAARASSRR